MNIILIGYRSSGKTSVGTRLAEKLSCPFYDTDQLIAREINRPICQLVAEKGWDHFRQKEREIVGKLTFLKNCVIATGGGMVVDRDNAERLRRLGVLAWLMADVDTIIRRMLSDPATATNRPSLTGEDFRRETEMILEKRTPIYRQLADIAVDTTDMKIDEVVEVMYKWYLRMREGSFKGAFYGR